MCKTISFSRIAIFIQILMFSYGTGFAQEQSINRLVVDNKVVAFANQIRIACFGNSITYGAGLEFPDEQAFPAQLQKILTEKYDDKCVVGKFAVSARTMMRQGDYPLWNEPEFSDGLDFAPDICIITLGTNDSKAYNWDKYPGEYKTDYLAMIDTLKSVNPNVQFLLCLPPPAYVDKWDIRDSVIVNGIIPEIISIAEKMKNAETVDFYSNLHDYGNHFTDQIHPDVEGSIKMAEILMEKIKKEKLIKKAIRNLK